MAGTAAGSIQQNPQTSLTQGQALRLAWCLWLILLSIPALVFLGIMWSFIDSQTPGNQTLAQNWFIGTMIYLALAVPLSFFLRSREFRAYWTGERVTPSHYLKGMLIVWLTMEIGGLAALLGCIVSQSLLPNLLPAMVAFVLFVPFWPSGRAMTSALGNEDDPEKYAEPR